ncbi:MAG TPA: response regulator [Bacteroidota bacterium]
MKEKLLNILIIEDNFEHLKLTRTILERNEVPGKIYFVRDGEEALDYVFRRSVFTDDNKYPMPDLILLDLKLPKLDGRAVLRALKQDPTLRAIPVVIVSTSERREDIEYALSTGAVAYISKSIGFDQLNSALSSVYKYADRKPE